MGKLMYTIVNVYAPCDLRGKKLLWEEIGNLMETRGGGEMVCVRGF